MKGKEIMDEKIYIRKFIWKEEDQEEENKK